VLIDRKFFFTRLLKCAQCKLNVRFPLDDSAFMESFYQQSYQAHYSEETHSITDMPADDALLKMMAENFPDKRNHAPFVKALLNSETGKVLDYGCSWGYSVFHLLKAGYNAEGFEISRPRAAFGKKLGVTIHYQHENIGTGFDLVMSNHAIEHLPVVADFILLAATLLKKEGLFMAFCPNGSPEYRQREPNVFHVNWGFLHPNYLDVEFAAHTFRKNPYLILTGDWNYDLNLLTTWDGKSQQIGNLRNGKELFIIAKPNIVL
jgi:SAM-dependent methyltransferase